MRALAAACIAFCAAGAAQAQQTIPRTSDGRPDFQGTWQSAFLTTTERMEGATALVASDDQARALVTRARAGFITRGVETDPNVFDADLDKLLRVGSEWRTSLVTEPTDGKLPYLPGVREKMLAEMRGQLSGLRDGPEARPDFERCLAGTGRAPMVNVNAHNVRRIVQTGDYLVIYTEEGGDVRVVSFAGARRPDVIRSFHGHSLARWEGDVLVLESTNFRPWYNRTVMVGNASRVIERFSFLSPDEILYRFTVEDSSIYAKPWSAEYTLTRTAGPAYEYGCHEGNASIVNVLKSGRVADSRIGQGGK